jgi:hypothetical protein
VKTQNPNPGTPDSRNVDPGTVELQLDVGGLQGLGWYCDGSFRDLDTDDPIQHVELELDGPRTENIGSPRLSNFSEGTK